MEKLESKDWSARIELIRVLQSCVQVWQDGKCKPDNKGNHGTIRDAKENTIYIKAANKRIADLAGLKVEQDGYSSNG